MLNQTIKFIYFITLKLLYLYLHLSLLFFFSFIGSQMVSVFWTWWFCYSISKSLSGSSGLSMLLWAYIIFEIIVLVALVKNIFLHLFILFYFFSPRFQRPPQMTAPLAFAYTAYAHGRLCPSEYRRGEKNVRI